MGAHDGFGTCKINDSKKNVNNFKNIRHGCGFFNHMNITGRNTMKFTKSRVMEVAFPQRKATNL